MQNVFPNLSKGKYQLLTLEAAAAGRSLYFWWWKYLRLSSDYWWMCQLKGKTSDREFAATYNKFGNVFEDSFETWWKFTGTNVFKYKLPPPPVRFIDETTVHQTAAYRGMYQVAIPMHYTKTQIFKQLRELLKDHEPIKISDEFATAYQASSIRGMGKKVLIDAHRIWCLNDAIIREKAAERLYRPEKYTQQWIGRKLEITPIADPTKYKSQKVVENERLAIRVKVNRYLSKANLIVRNVEIGKFPSLDAVPEVARWTKKQLAEKQEAIESRVWICPESCTDEVLALLT